MANSRNDAAKPMPFPGESPTVSLAMAAGRMYAPSPDGDEKPARAKPKRSGAKKSSAKKPARRSAKAKKAARRPR